MRKITITPKDVVRLRVMVRDYNRSLLRLAEEGRPIKYWRIKQGVSIYREYLGTLQDYAVLCGRKLRELERERILNDVTSNSSGETGIREELSHSHDVASTS